MRREAAVALEPFGLRPRHLITLTVLRDGGAVSQQALAGTLRIDRTNLVGLLNDLEDDGLIERRRSREDRRRHDVELTEQGRRHLAKAEFALAAVEGEVLRALDPEQREQLFGLLQLATRGCVEDPAAACVEGPTVEACLADDPGIDAC
ncbi:MAG: MarR family winged helix-turn-helix transcriptional regulator [Solirubrobacteraceae bacterium]